MAFSLVFQSDPTLDSSNGSTHFVIVFALFHTVITNHLNQNGPPSFLCFIVAIVHVSSTVTSTEDTEDMSS